MVRNLKETIDWESAIGKRAGAILNRPLVVQGDPPSTPSRRMAAPQATSTMLTKKQTRNVDDTTDEAGPERTKLKPLAETLKGLEQSKMYHEFVKDRERKKMRADYAAGRKFRAQEDAALAEEFPGMSPRKRRSAKRMFTPRQASKDRLTELQQKRDDLVEYFKEYGYHMPQLYKHHFGKSPTKPGPLPSEHRFMSKMRDPELEKLMAKYRSTDEEQKQRSNQILNHLSNRNVDDREFYNTFMENVFSPPPARLKNVRRNLLRPELSEQAWLERGNVPDPTTLQREAVQRRTAKSKAYLEQLKRERETRFRNVEEMRKRHYERDQTEDYWLSDDEPDTVAEQILMLEKGVTLDSPPREVVDFVIPEEDLLNLSMVSDQSIIAPEAIPTSQITAKQNLPGDGQHSLIDIPMEDDEEEILQEGSENFDEIYENAKQTRSPVESPVSVDLKVRAPKTANFIQMQGSEMPSWFSGFHVAIPGDGSQIRCERSPSAALLLALRKMQPGLLHVF